MDHPVETFQDSDQDTDTEVSAMGAPQSDEVNASAADQADDVQTKEPAVETKKRKDLYRNPLTYVTVGVAALALVGGGVFLKNATANQSTVLPPPDPKQTSESTSAPETGGIENNLTVSQIDAIYEKNYGDFGDNPPFNKAQFEITIRNLSPDDAAYVLSSLQGSVSDYDVSKLLHAQGLGFDQARYPLDQ